MNLGDWEDWQPKNENEEKFIQQFRDFHKKLRKIGFGKISRITENIFLGSFSDATNLELLDNYNITAILSFVGADYPTQSQIYNSNIKFLSFPAEDLPNYPIEEHFTESFIFLSKCEEENRKILVHCKAGVSRSATVLIAYLMHKIKTYKTTLHELEIFLTHQKRKQFSFADLFQKLNAKTCPIQENVLTISNNEMRMANEEECAIGLLFSVFYFVKKNRGTIHPNDGFLIQLWYFAKR